MWIPTVSVRTSIPQADQLKLSNSTSHMKLASEEGGLNPRPPWIGLTLVRFLERGLVKRQYCSLSRLEMYFFPINIKSIFCKIYIEYNHKCFLNAFHMLLCTCICICIWERRNMWGPIRLPLGGVPSPAWGEHPPLTVPSSHSTPPSWFFILPFPGSTFQLFSTVDFQLSFLVPPPSWFLILHPNHSLFSSVCFQMCPNTVCLRRCKITSVAFGHPPPLPLVPPLPFQPLPFSFAPPLPHLTSSCLFVPPLVTFFLITPCS